MNVIVFSKRHGKARQFELGRPMALSITLLTVFSVLGGVLLLGMQLGSHGIMLNPAIGVVEWSHKLDEQHRQVNQAKQELQERLDV